MRSFAIYLKNVHEIFEHARRDAREIVEAHPAILVPRNPRPPPPCPTRSTYATLSNIESARIGIEFFRTLSLLSLLLSLSPGTRVGVSPPVGRSFIRVFLTGLHYAGERVNGRSLSLSSFFSLRRTPSSHPYSQFTSANVNGTGKYARRLRTKFRNFRRLLIPTDLLREFTESRSILANFSCGANASAVPRIFPPPRVPLIVMKRGGGRVSRAASGISGKLTTRTSRRVKFAESRAIRLKETASSAGISTNPETYKFPSITRSPRESGVCMCARVCAAQPPPVLLLKYFSQFPAL